MEFQRGKMVAILAAVAAIGAVGLVAFIFRGRIQEEYWVWRLRAAGNRESLVRYLADHGPPEAMGALLENADREVERHPECWSHLYLPLIFDNPERSFQDALDAASRALSRLKSSALPFLWERVGDRRANVRALAVCLIADFYFDGNKEDAPISRIDLIRRADPSERVRRMAEGAISILN